jgi:nitrogenase molybdenum-cofactor synthesis protein NifE
VIGDDVDWVCRDSERRFGARFINVKSPGFAGHKAMGYKLACEAIFELIKPFETKAKKSGINILGDYNLAGEIWIIKNYFKEIGIEVVSVFTGDSSYQSLTQAPRAALNVVQCAGSMTYLAKMMEERFSIPYIKVSFFGLEDTASALTGTADLAGNDEARRKARALAEREGRKTQRALEKYLPLLKGKKAAIYVGGGFKAISLVRQFKALGMEIALVGTQTGSAEDYELLAQISGPSAVVLDDANPAELETFMRLKGADILVGGVKERPLAYKMGTAFCDHNHERKAPLAGFVGVENFAREISLSVNSPVWAHARADSFSG